MVAAGRVLRTPLVLPFTPPADVSSRIVFPLRKAAEAFRAIGAACIIVDALPLLFVL